MSKKELTYKPMVNQKISELFEHGALVHMLEFMPPKKDSIHLSSLCAAFDKKDKGFFSQYSRVHFDEGKQKFASMPSSALHKNIAFKLYDTHNNVGLIIDPNLCEFHYISTKDADSIKDEIKQNYIHITILNSVPELVEINLGKDKTVKKSMQNVGDKTRMLLPPERSKQDEEALHNYFDDKFFKLYQTGKVDTTYISEIGVNAPISAIRGIMVSNANKPQEYPDRAADLNLAYLLQQVFKQKTKVELPIISYDRSKGDKPEIREIAIDTKEMAKTLRENPEIGKIFTECLGKDFLKNLGTAKGVIKK